MPNKVRNNVHSNQQEYPLYYSGIVPLEHKAIQVAWSISIEQFSWDTINWPFHRDGLLIQVCGIWLLYTSFTVAGR